MQIGVSYFLILCNIYFLVKMNLEASAVVYLSRDDEKSICDRNQ